MAVDSEKESGAAALIWEPRSALWPAGLTGRGPRIIQNKTGQDTTQSVVYYNPEKEEYIVGQPPIAGA